MDEQLVADLADDIRALIARGGSLDDTNRKLRERINRSLGRFAEAESEHLQALEEATRRVRAELGTIEYMQRPALRRLDRPVWYAGPSTNARTWSAMLASLKASGRDEQSIDSLDSTTTGILSLTDRPSADTFRTIGLVVGHVQSGKTGNMAGLMAKASDTEFKFFLVLSGLTDALREQTQARLDSDVVQLSATDWYMWTATGRDFDHPPARGFQFDHRRQLAVIKKNGGVLRRFLRKIRNTPKTVLADTPFMIIDDECDQASVSSARYVHEMTVINGLIRQLIEELPRVAYVGYTATPFANVLIDPTSQPDKPDNLYPRDFIFPLPAPNNYFGPLQLFGRAALLGDADEDTAEPFDMVRPIPADEIASMRPSSRSRRHSFVFKVGASLESALLYFILASAARLARKHNDHSTMLVHTSFYTDTHEKARKAIASWMKHFRRKLEANDANLISQMRTLWVDEGKRVEAKSLGLKTISFSALSSKLRKVAAALEVVVENSDSESRVDYSSDRSRTYVVVGGNVLARGLTLYGLVVSYFLRTSSQYDTLMQMGRWFGYRPDYEDLPRVWMESTVRMAFRDLATVEAEVRRDIERYQAEQVTPAQFAVRIRRLPGMLITARNKMLAAKECQISYGNQHLQTSRFYHKDPTWLEKNWSAGSSLLHAAREHGVTSSSDATRAVFTDVPCSDILEFLNRYSVHPTHVQLQVDRVQDYVRKALQAGERRLAKWNVAVIGSSGGRPLRVALGPVLGTNMVVRSRLFLDDGDDVADIKALMSRRDIVADYGVRPPGDRTWDEHKALRSRDGMPPLCLLYPIDKESSPQARGSESGQTTRGRAALNAAFDVLGLGLVFPDIAGGAATYVSVDLPPLEHEEVEDSDVAPTFDLEDGENN